MVNRRVSVSRHAIRQLTLIGVFASFCSAVAASNPLFEQDQLDRIPDRMREFVKAGQITGAVTLVATRDGIVHLESVGLAEPTTKRPMRKDSIFRIASMTKTITATALMILADEGKLVPDDPVEKFIPEFRGQKLKDGTPVRPVTLKDILTHTAGLYRPKREELAKQTLEETAVQIGRARLAFEPGSKWQYSSGLTVAGRIIEIVSGKPYDVFLKERIFEPLGMNDTTFTMNEEQGKRGVYLLYKPGTKPENVRVFNPPKAPNPSGGLFSTAHDLARFYRMILGGGELDGKRIISQESITRMTTLHTPDDVVTGFTPGNGWGLGWCIVRNPQGVSRLLSSGTYGHGGAFGTQAWLDPQREAAFILLIQRSRFGNADGSDIRDAFQEEAVAAIRGRRFPTARFVKFHGYEQAIELKNESTRVVLCPQVGGRVLEYSLNGKNALYLSDEEKNWKPGDRPQASAGRFDIGPELVVPRRQTLWSGVWSGEITGRHSARLTSRKDEATGVQLIRDFSLDAKTSRLLCTQTIMNVSDEVKEWCHWSRTFATGNGICVIPLSDHSRFPNKYVMYEEGGLINARPEDPNIRVRDGFLEILGVPRKPKLGFDSYAGWMAYLTRDDLLFVKKFKTYPNRVYNEAAGLTISVWYPEDRRVELEPIGPRERLEPGQVASFTEEWSLKPHVFPADRKAADLKKISELADD